MSEPGTSRPSGSALFVRDLWYMAALAAPFRPGTMRRVMLLGEPVAIGRMKNGELFALRDICPHRGVPLSAGKVMADDSVQCPYHGWRFKGGGTCSLIPSLVEGQALDPAKIKVRSYPVEEQDGLIWVYMAAKPGSAPKGLPPKVPMIDSRIRWHETQMFPCDIDHAVIGLMDPCHAAFVHDHWWWKKTPKVKEKHYAPLPLGFEMTRHKPTKPAYAMLGEVSTEITFELPSTRFEIVEGKLFGRPFRVVSLTVCTPREADKTDIIQAMYWPRWLFWIKPFFTLLGATFIADDRKIVELQQEGLKFDPHLMLIQDADQPAIWYHRVKKAWAESVENGTEFVNPVQEKVLRWRS